MSSKNRRKSPLNEQLRVDLILKDLLTRIPSTSADLEPIDQITTQRSLKNPCFDAQLDCETSAITSINQSLKECRIESASELKAMQKQKRLVDLISKASNFTRNGEYQTAISIFSKALAIDDKCADAYCGRGAANAGNKNLTGALYDLNKAIEIEPKHANANKYRLAVMIAHAKNLEKDSTMQKDAQKMYRDAWKLSGRKSQEALAALKRLDSELIQCIDLSGDDAETTSSAHLKSTIRKRTSTQMAKEDAKKLNDIESYIKSMRKK